MKKDVPVLGALLAAAMLFASCKPHVIRGGGPETTENRTVPGFTKVDIEVPAHAEISVSPGATAGVSLSGSQNILSEVRTEVREGTLKIFIREGAMMVTDEKIRATITMPALEALDLSGASDADIKGTVSGNRLDIDVSGAGRVTAADVQVQDLEADISGSGDLSIATGATGKASFDISGSGSVRAFGFVAQNIEADVSGSGDMEVNAVQQLDAEVSGSGNIRYKGSPNIRQEVSGAGSISSAN